MSIQRVSLILITVLILGVTLALVWVQTGLPSGISASPWDFPVHLFGSLYALWIPLTYLFFSSIWCSLLHQFAGDDIRRYAALDCYSYMAIVAFLLLQIAWSDLGEPTTWFRGSLLLILLVKSLFLVRAIYLSPRLLHPVLLLILGIGEHLLLVPFTSPSLVASLPNLFRQEHATQLAIIASKAVGLNLMTLEMFRLGRFLTKSRQSAFFCWLAVTLTFPVLGLPKMSHILAGLLIIFILRLIFSRLNTRELMIGLLTPTNVMILLKLLVVVVLFLAAGGVFWSNVNPGFGFHGVNALRAITGMVFDGQFGLVCCAPVYWLAGFGVAYLLFFMVWDGVLLVITGAILYLGYHFVAYGVLDRVIEPSASIPFLPVLGVFVAVAHKRFRRMALFRFGMRFLIVLTIGVTCCLLLFYPEFSSVHVKMAEIQRAVVSSLGRDVTVIFPSFVFRPFSISFFLWLGTFLVLALVLCNARTRTGWGMMIRIKHPLRLPAIVPEIPLAPCLVCALLLLGLLVVQFSGRRHELPPQQPVHLSRTGNREEIQLSKPLRSQAIVLVSSMTESVEVPHDAPVANVTVFGEGQRFEFFTLKPGRDTSEAWLEHPDIKTRIAHSRATVYRSWNLEADDGTLVTAHDYYTKFSFLRPLWVQKITFKFLDPTPEEKASTVTVQIKEVYLETR